MQFFQKGSNDLYLQKYEQSYTEIKHKFFISKHIRKLFFFLIYVLFMMSFAYIIYLTGKKTKKYCDIISYIISQNISCKTNLDSYTRFNCGIK